MTSIEQLTPEDFDGFLAYLDDHLSDNGRDRKAGLGGRLLAHAEQWAAASARLEWMDLQVLSSNAPAIHLYLRHGFHKTGEIPAMFNIDGQLFSYTGMSKHLGQTS